MILKEIIRSKFARKLTVRQEYQNKGLRIPLVLLDALFPENHSIARVPGMQEEKAQFVISDNRVGDELGFLNPVMSRWPTEFFPTATPMANNNDITIKEGHFVCRNCIQHDYLRHEPELQWELS
jgi:hypothetical protein